MLRRAPVDEAPDIVSETLLTAWRKVRELPTDDEQACWWLLAIARRVLANYRRGNQRRNALADRLRALPMAVSYPLADTIEGSAAEAIARLPEDDQELMRLVYWDGLTARAAAAVMGISDAAARKRLQRSRDSLRRELSSHPESVHSNSTRVAAI